MARRRVLHATRGEDGVWPWYYVSRNRKARWDDPAYTVLANGRHVTLHPASSTMELEWSDLSDGWKQRWRFTGQYEHLDADQKRPTLPRPRRLGASVPFCRRSALTSSPLVR